MLQDVQSDGAGKVVFFAARFVDFGNQRINAAFFFIGNLLELGIKFRLDGYAGLVPAGNDDGFFKHFSF